jgi:hypothetical protein
MQTPFQFLAVKGALDIVRRIGDRTCGVCREVALELRRALATQRTDRCAIVCLLLSHMMHESAAFGRALRTHFWMLGPGLNRFVCCADRADYSAVGHTHSCSLGEHVSHVLWQLEACCGRAVRPLLQRFVPLYEGEV